MPDTPRLVALQLPAGPGLLAALRACWDEGDAVLPVDPGLPARALQHVLADLRPHALHTAAAPAEAITLPSPLPVAAGTAAVITTSGSAGAAKGVVLSRRALDAAVDASLARLGARDGERWLACLPLFHVAGLLTVLRTWRLGGEPVVHTRFEPAAVAGADADHVALVPTMLARLLDAGADLRRFRTVLLGGAAAPPALLARAAAAGVRVVRTYGLTETCGGCVYDGVPLDGVDADVDADGHIRIRGPVLFDGYHGGAAGTEDLDPDGWLRTADVGRFDERGRLEILGRADDVIVTGGENVPAAAVEALLLAHPGIVDVVVVGRPDAEWGEAVTAVVVPTRDGHVPALDDLRRHVSATAPPAWAPRRLEVVDGFPMLPSGKPDRLAVRGYGALP